MANTRQAVFVASQKCFCLVSSRALYSSKIPSLLFQQSVHAVPCFDGVSVGRATDPVFLFIRWFWLEQNSTLNIEVFFGELS